MDHGGGDGARRVAERPAVPRGSDGREAGCQSSCVLAPFFWQRRVEDEGNEWGPTWPCVYSRREQVLPEERLHCLQGRKRKGNSQTERIEAKHLLLSAQKGKRTVHWLLRLLAKRSFYQVVGTPEVPSVKYILHPSLAPSFSFFNA